MRAFLVVLDSVGIGAAPDAAAYGDTGANTLGHIGEAVPDFHLPAMQKMGLGNIPSLLPTGICIRGVEPTPRPTASWGALRELSAGKDTTTGHWELAGLLTERGFHIFPPQYPSFPPQLIAEFEKRTGRKTIGNRAASGTAIIAELGAEQMKTGAWIVYTSADSVFQIAAHEDIIPLPELYRGCETARELCNPLHVGRVIARPYIGTPGSFQRTENRRDFSLPLPEPTILDILNDAGVAVTTVGKLDDIFAHRGITHSHHVENNRDAEESLVTDTRKNTDGFWFANLIDFDMLYGHRRDAKGYARALEQADSFFERWIPMLTPSDILMVTADHGNDPTFKGTDHTREYVPLLAYRPGRRGINLGIRNGYFDVAQSLASFFGISPIRRGVSFI